MPLLPEGCVAEGEGDVPPGEELLQRRGSRDTRGAEQAWGALLWEDRPRAVCVVPPSCSVLCFACNI